MITKRLLFGPLLMITAMAQADSLSKAEALYLQGNYSESINECADYTGSKLSGDKAYYIIGLNYLRLKDSEKAREKANFIFNNFPSSRFISPAKILYADTYLIEGSYEKAKDLYLEILKSNGSSSAIAYSRLIQCSLKSGDWQDARQFLNALEQKYPLSLEADSAKKFFDENPLFFTLQAGAFSNLNNAKRLIRRLKDKGFDAYLSDTRNNDKRLYRVRIGRLNTLKEANALRKQLERTGFPSRIYP